MAGVTLTSLLNQRPSVSRLFPGANHHCRRHAVAGLEIQQAHALCGASGFADGRRIHADDFAVLADQHDFGLLRDLRDAYDFAVAFGGFDVDDAGTAAPLQAVLVGGGALAVSVFGDRENQRALLPGSIHRSAVLPVSGFGLGFFGVGFRLSRVFRRRRHADDVVFLVQLHAAHAGRRCGPWSGHRSSSKRMA